MDRAFFRTIFHFSSSFFNFIFPFLIKLTAWKQPILVDKASVLATQAGVLNSDRDVCCHHNEFSFLSFVLIFTSGLASTDLNLPTLRAHIFQFHFSISQNSLINGMETAHTC